MRISVLKDDVLSFDVAKIMETLLKCLNLTCRSGRRAKFQNTYPGNFPRLLRLSHNATERECENNSEDPHPFSIFDPSAWLRTCFGFPIIGARETKPNSKFVVHLFFSLIQNRQSKIQNYLITRSALANTFGGIVTPICFAVFRLITSSNFIGCSTGRSAGLVPFKILSTYVAARRYKSSKFVP